MTYRKRRRTAGYRAWDLCLSAVLILLLVVSGSEGVLALSSSQKQLYERGVYAFDLEVGCSTSSPLDRDGRYQTVWSFFTAQNNLSAEAAAGIMGNLEAESGIDPWDLQNTAPPPLKDGPEMPTETGPEGPVPHSAIKGKYGYGIAQWTSAGRQQNLIDYAQETRRSTGDLMLQLDFLWRELNQDYIGVMAVLQTPGITIKEASYVVLSEFETPKPFTKIGTEQQRAATAAARLARAQSIYTEFKDQLGGTGIASLSSCGVGGPIDLESPDTTHIPCTNGTEDAGVADGYRDGRLIKLRLCKVGGTRVNSQLAGTIKQMLDDSAAAKPKRIPLGINGSFRTMEDQIRVYRSWCQRGGLTPTPPPYPRPRDEYTRCPGAAPPGYSNHQQGLALDLECDDVIIPMAYSAALKNDCFQWLLMEGKRYYLYEWGKGESRGASGYEGWHWSVDGG